METNNNKIFSIVRIKEDVWFTFYFMEKSFCETFIEKTMDRFPEKFSINHFAILIGDIPYENLKYVSDYLLAKKHEWIDLIEFISTKKIIELKSSLQNFLNTVVANKDFVVLEPAYNKIKDSYMNGIFDKGKLDILFKKYVIMEHYFKILSTIKNGMIETLFWDKEYIWFPKFERNRNEIRKYILDKNKIALSDEMFIPYGEYTKILKRVEEKKKVNEKYVSEYYSIEKCFEILQKQKVKKDVIVHHFFNELIAKWFPDNYRKVKVDTLKKIPSFRKYVYVKLGMKSSKWKELAKRRDKNLYEANNDLLNVLYSYNKNLYFYKPLYFLVKKIYDNKWVSTPSIIRESKAYVESFKWEVEAFTKKSVNKSDHLTLIRKNFAHIIEHLDMYASYVVEMIKSFQDNNEEFDLDKIFKFFKKNSNRVEDLLGFTIYKGYDLWDDKINKTAIKKIQESNLLKRDLK